MAAASVFGRGLDPLLDAAFAGRPGFAPVRRFAVADRRVEVAAAADGAPDLVTELLNVIAEACDLAGLSPAGRAGTPLYLACHGDPGLPRAAPADRARHGADRFAARIAAQAGLFDGTAAGAEAAAAAGLSDRTAAADALLRPRAYTSACVAGSTAVADAAAAIAHGRLERAVVAAGYLVDPDQFALFDAGRTLATDGQVRPFSVQRSGLLLGDGLAAVVVESAAAARARGARPAARIAGWGRAGDAYHVVRPRPDGAGLARAVTAALARGGVPGEQVGYVNAHGSGTAYSDAAEAAALHAALGGWAAQVPVSSTKSVHGQALEAGALLELAVTVGALAAGRLPVNAGYLGPDPDCAVNLVLEPTTPAEPPQYALTVNSAFGGANTALLVGAA